MWILYAFGTFEVKMSCYKIQPAKTLKGAKEEKVTE